MVLTIENYMMLKHRNKSQICNFREKLPCLHPVIMNRGCFADRVSQRSGISSCRYWTTSVDGAYITDRDGRGPATDIGRRDALGAKQKGSQTMDIVTRLHIHFKTRLVGNDSFGNRYYEERKARPGKPPRRYVRYNGMVEASKVPADWHGWLHHTEDSPPPPEGYARHDWQLDHQPNTTGTKLAHRPAGHLLKGGKRAPATGDYEPWSPS